MRYSFSREDVAEAHSEASLEKARETKRLRAEERRAFVLAARAYGWTVGRITQEAGLSEATVEKWLAGTPHRRQYGRGVIECPHDPPCARGEPG